MARETKEQRLEREAHEALEREMERQQFLKTLPKRLFEAQVLARSLGLHTETSLCENGPLLKIKCEDSDTYFEDAYSYLSDSWQIDNLEEQLKNIRNKQEAYAARRELAKAAFAKLTKEEKDAICEHIQYLRWL